MFIGFEKGSKKMVFKRNITCQCAVENVALHPGKLTWNPKKKCLEDDFPLQLGDFVVPCSFSRVYKAGHHPTQEDRNHDSQSTDLT